MLETKDGIVPVIGQTLYEVDFEFKLQHIVVYKFDILPSATLPTIEYIDKYGKHVRTSVSDYYASPKKAIEDSINDCVESIESYIESIARIQEDIKYLTDCKNELADKLQCIKEN